MHKNILTVVGIVILFINMGFSGCFEEDKKQDDTNRFIGTWRLVEQSFGLNYPYVMDNNTEETWTFYENKSSKITSIRFMEYPEEPNATININWASFEVRDGRLYLTFFQPMYQDNLTIWSDYQFSNNDTKLTLSIPGFSVQKYNKIE